jgi:hypothetical protein
VNTVLFLNDAEREVSITALRPRGIHSLHLSLSSHLLDSLVNLVIGFAKGGEFDLNEPETKGDDPTDNYNVNKREDY